MRILKQLIEEPGREFHVLDLTGSRGAVGELVDIGDSGDAIDKTARDAYRARILELRELATSRPRIAANNIDSAVTSTVVMAARNMSGPISTTYPQSKFIGAPGHLGHPWRSGAQANGRPGTPAGP